MTIINAMRGFCRGNTGELPTSSIYNRSYSFFLDKTEEVMEAILKKEIIIDRRLSRIMAVTAFVIFTSLGAFVRIPLPFTPVPITLQTFFVLLSGALLGGNLGLVSQLSYVLLGMSGLPIFSGASSGLIYLLGPTGGYLLGFVFASLFAGKAIRYAQDNLLYIFAILCIADFILLSCGVIWLRMVLGYPFIKLMLVGFIPFLPGDLLKAGIAAGIYLKLKTRLREIL